MVHLSGSVAAIGDAMIRELAISTCIILINILWTNIMLARVLYKIQDIAEKLLKKDE